MYISLVPRPHPAFQCYTLKTGGPGKRSHVGYNSGGTVIIMRGRPGMIANCAKCTVLAIVHYKLNFELHMLCSYAGQDLYTAWDLRS